MHFILIGLLLLAGCDAGVRRQAEDIALGGGSGAAVHANVATHRTAAGQNSLILPRPKSVQLGDGLFKIDKATHWCVADGSEVPVEQRYYLAHLIRGLQQRRNDMQKALSDVVLEKSSGAQRHFYLFQAPQACGKMNADTALPNNPEGYHLSVTSEMLHIAATTDAGLFYGINTVLQLLDNDLSIAAVDIVDFPDWSFRGVHLPLRNGPNGRTYGTDMDLFEKVLRLCAALKLNYIVLQIDEALDYESHPELEGDVSKERMRAAAAMARRYYIEIIPQLEAFGHVRHFIFNGGKTHADLAQNPSDEKNRFWDYCPCKEEVYELYFDLWEEVLDIFKPRYVHIGHDEIKNFGDCDACGDTSAPELLAKSINRFHAYFAAKGVKTMVWGDMLLSHQQFPDASYVHGDREEAYRALALIPKDVAILDWHYKEGKPPKDKYPTAAYLKKQGFPVYGVPAGRTVNVFSFAKYLKTVGGDGMVVSTWNAFNKADTIKKDFRSRLERSQGIVTGADYFWNLSNSDWDKLPYDPKKVQADSLDADRLVVRP